MIEPDQFDEKLAAVAPVQRFVIGQQVPGSATQHDSRKKAI